MNSKYPLGSMSRGVCLGLKNKCYQFKFPCFSISFQLPHNNRQDSWQNFTVSLAVGSFHILTRDIILASTQLINSFSILETIQIKGNRQCRVQHIWMLQPSNPLLLCKLVLIRELLFFFLSFLLFFFLHFTLTVCMICMHH